MTKTKQETLLAAGMIGLLLLLYHSALQTPYFGDDFQWFFPRPLEMLLGNFLHKAPDNNWYRPLQSTILASIQFLWGYDTLPIRIIHFFIHASFGLLIFRALRYWKVQAGTAAVVAFYFICTQASGYPVAANDMVSQMMGSFFAVLTLWTLYRSKDTEKNYYRSMLLALVFFFLALFSKETSAGLCLGVFALFLIMAPSQKGTQRVLLALKQSLPFALIGIIYVIMRNHASAIMPSYGSGTYQMDFGTNIIKNIALFAFQAILPFSSTQIMHELYDRAWPQLGAIVMFTGIFTGFWCYGIWKSPRRSLVFVLLVFSLFSLIPALFLNHVSESYLYNALPYLMIVFGFIIEYYWKYATRRILYSFIAILAVAFIANARGSFEKSNALAEESTRSQVLMLQMYPIISSLPSNGILYLVNPIEHEFEYSVFAMKGFEPVKYADPWILRHTNRPDVKLFVLDSTDYQDSVKVHPGAAYSMDMETLRIKPF